MPGGNSSLYTYADDSALGIANKSFQVIESTLQKDLGSLSCYFHQWHLKLSLPKTVCSLFHLANRCANTTLSISLNGERLNFDPTPKYLGVTLDRSLNFSFHAKAVASKTEARVNLLKRLAGTGWGASFDTMRTSTLALAYSTAEYAAPAWSHSSHTKNIDVALNSAMRLVSGSLIATPVDNLPILSGIAPPELRRDFMKLKLSRKASEQSLIPPPSHPQDQRIPRRHFASDVSTLLARHPYQPSWTRDRWTDQWDASTSPLRQFINSPSNKPHGCVLPRNSWVNLNRIRSGVGRTKHFLHKIGAEPSDSCECGEAQTIKHIVSDCNIYQAPHGFEGIMQLDDDTVDWLSSSLPV
jgi:hypothetical protein